MHFSFSRFFRSFNRHLIYLTLIAVCVSHGMAETQRPLPRPSLGVYSALAAVPTSPTAVVSATVDVYMVVLTNTNASTQATVTASCTTGGVVFLQALLNGVSSQGNHLAIPYPDGLTCAGGVTWSSDVAGVTGSITGKQ